MTSKVKAVINLNDSVRVKLSEELEEFLQQKHESFWQETNPRYLKDNPVSGHIKYARDGYFHTQMWGLIELLEGECHLGNQPPLLEFELLE